MSDTAKDIASISIEIKSVGAIEAIEQLTALGNAAQFAAAAINVLNASLAALKSQGT